MAMATLRLKPRTMGVEGGKDKEVPGTLIGDKSPDDKGQVQKAAATVQAPYGSLREYLKTSH
jgi:uncharacterized protein YjbJ (UPF0337 family)